MAAYECGTLDFPEPPYPNTIQCPQVNLIMPLGPVYLYDCHPIMGHCHDILGSLLVEMVLQPPCWKLGSGQLLLRFL